MAVNDPAMTGAPSRRKHPSATRSPSRIGILPESISKNVYYVYGTGGQLDRVEDNGGTVIADYDYNADGDLSGIDRDSAAPDQSWTYDPIGRLATTGWANAGTNSVSWAFTRNPANQILSEIQTNDAYSWDGHSSKNWTFASNGLNQYTAVDGVQHCYDKNGNLTFDGVHVYLYDVENRLVEMRAKTNTNCLALSYSGQIQARLNYDPLGRLYKVEGYVAGVTQGPKRFLYDGDALIAEYGGSGGMVARYVHGAAAEADDPIASYAGPGVAAAERRNLYADARGSIVLSTSSNGTSPEINTYDEYGVPIGSNTGRFQYTGQAWFSELGLYYYKARMYSPLLGRFLQTDPIGYEDQNNLYGYVANDPVNMVDPNGTCAGPLIIPCAIAAEEVIVAGAAAAAAACVAYCPSPEQVKEAIDQVIDKITPDPVPETTPAPAPAPAPAPRGGTRSEAKSKKPPKRAGDSNRKGHDKGARGSTRPRHEGGNATGRRDRDGEKGDNQRRPPRKPPGGKTPKGGWPPKKKDF